MRRIVKFMNYAINNLITNQQIQSQNETNLPNNRR